MNRGSIRLAFGPRAAAVQTLNKRSQHSFDFNHLFGQIFVPLPIEIPEIARDEDLILHLTC